MCDDCGEKARITSIKAALLAYQAYNTNTRAYLACWHTSIPSLCPYFLSH